MQALARLRGLTAHAAQQLYGALVVPAITYAASVWTSINKNTEISYWITKPLEIVQKTAAQVITGLFKTVSIHIAEAEAGIDPLDIQVRRRVIKHWISCHTLLHSHPFWQCRRAAINQNGKHQSLFTTLARICPINVEAMEVIQPFAVSPYTPSIGDLINLGEATDLDHEQHMSC